VIGAAVIGLNQGLNHCRGYSRAKNARLLAVSDLVDELLNKAKKEFNSVDTYKDYKEILKRDDIDVVSVTVPPFLHTQIAMDIIESGKHVMLEKPMALTLEDCDRMIDTAKKKGVKIGVQFNKRFHPIFKEIRFLIDEGAMGRIAAVSATYWRFPFGVMSKPGKWSGKRKYAGNMLFEDGIHYLDLLRWFGGEVKQVQCVDNDWVRDEFDFSQIAYVNLEYEGGGIGNFSQTINGFGNSAIMWVIGTKSCVLANLTYDPKGDLVVMMLKAHQKDIEEDRRPEIVRTKNYSGIMSTYLESIDRHFQEFVNRIEKGEEPPITGIDGRKAVELCLAADKSARERQPVKLPLRETPGFEEKELAQEEISKYYANTKKQT